MPLTDAPRLRQAGLLGIFLVRHADGQTAQQQGRADAVLSNDDLGVLAQRVFDHLWHFMHVPDRTKRSSQDSARRYGDSSPSIVSVMRLVISQQAVAV